MLNADTSYTRSFQSKINYLMNSSLELFVCDVLFNIVKFCNHSLLKYTQLLNRLLLTTIYF